MLSKNKKSLFKSVALVGAVTATGAVATTTAHADDSTTNSQTTASATDPAQNQLDQLKQQHTQAEDQLTKQNDADYQAYQKTVQPQIDQAQDQLKQQQANQTASDAQAVQQEQTKLQAAADTATKQENNSYQNAVNTESAQYAGKVAAQQAQNDKALQNASANIVTPAQQEQQRQEAKTAYDNQVSQAEGQKESAVKTAKADHDKQAASLQNQITQKQSTAKADHDTQLRNAQDAVNNAQSKVNGDTQANTQAQSALTNAKTQLENAQHNLDDVNAKVGNNFIPRGTISGNRYGADFDVTWNEDDLRKVDNDKRLVVWIAGNGQKCVCKLDPVRHLWGYYALDSNGNVTNQRLSDDESITGNSVMKLTDDEINELTIWTANVLNYIREQVGSVPVHVSQESLAATKDAMQQYIEKDKDRPLQHDVSIYNNVANKYSLPNFASSIRSDMDYLIYGQGRTMSDLKRGVLGLLHNLITDTDGLSAKEKEAKTTFGHRYHLLGLNDPVGPYSWNAENDGTPYFGLGQEYYCEHIFISTDGYNQHDIPLTDLNTEKINKLQQVVDTAQTNYNNAKTKADQTANQLATDTQTLNTAKDALAKVQANKVVDSPEVTQLKQQLQQLDTDYHAKLTSIDNQYKQIEQKYLDQYNQQIKDINAKPTNVDSLKHILDQKLTDLKTKHDAKLSQLAKDHQTKLDAIKADADKQLADFKQKLSIKNTKENQSLVDQINKLQQQLTTRKDQLDKNLTDLKTEDDAEYNALKAKLEPKNEVTSAVKSNSDSYTTSGGQMINLKPENENINAVAFTQTIYPTRESIRKQQVVSQHLPQTGNSSSLIIVAMGVLSSMFGLGLIRKSKDI